MQRAATKPNHSRAGSHPDGSGKSGWRSRTAALTFGVLTGSGCAATNPAEDAPKSQATQLAATAIAEATTVRDAMDDGAKGVDVRTPEEFATGHLQGAVNIDLAAPDFDERIAALDKTVIYVVYCASGNRARTAIESMTDQGFDDLINGGGYEDLAADGLPTN